MAYDPERAYNIHDLREAAQRVLPKGLFEFLARGSEDDLAVRRNHTKFADITMRTRVLVDVSQRSQATTFFGQRSEMPIAIAPTGLAGLLSFEGELHVARAAAQAGIPFTLSTASIVSMERVKAEAGGRLWYQLYMVPDRKLSFDMVERVKKAGYEALIFTLDTPTAPNREYLNRSGFVLPMRVTPGNALDVALHPRWLFGVLLPQYLRYGVPKMVNYPDAPSIMAPRGKARREGRPRSDRNTWADLRELRRMWNGPLLLKGILHPEDAALAAECGVDGVIVSNHGGRNFDSSIAPVEALVAIADRVGHRMEVWVDGGVERGSDVAKALALGARGVFVGRAPLWGVTAAGQGGASRAIELLRQEIDRVLAFTGCVSVEDLDRSLLHLPQGFGDMPPPVTRTGREAAVKLAASN